MKRSLNLCLAISLGLILFLTQTSLVFASTLLLNPPFGTIDQNHDLKVDVVVNGQNETIDGVDVVLDYDTSMLSVKQLTQGKFFGQYPLLKDDKGKIKIVALGPTDGVKIFGDIVVASVDFDVIDSGQAKLSFEYSSGSTNLSNVPTHLTSTDTLTGVTGGTYSVTASPQKLQQLAAKKVPLPPSPLLLFLLIVVLIGVGIWYYLKKRKPKENVFKPEPFPLDKPPKLE